jgi:hypothetical protein
VLPYASTALSCALQLEQIGARRAHPGQRSCRIIAGVCIGCILEVAQGTAPAPVPPAGNAAARASGVGYSDGSGSCCQPRAHLDLVPADVLLLIASWFSADVCRDAISGSCEVLPGIAEWRHIAGIRRRPRRC